MCGSVFAGINTNLMGVESGKSMQSHVSDNDIAVLRRLGEWQAAAAATAENEEKIQAWLDHDAGCPGHRPMLLVEIHQWEGAHGPVCQGDLQCQHPWARAVEYRMRNLQHHVEVYRDDHVVPDFIALNPVVSRSDFGITSAQHREGGADRLAFNYSEAPLCRLDDADFAKLHHRVPACDHEHMNWQREQLEKIFRGILPIEVHDAPWQFHVPLTSTALDLVGLENFMLLMFDNPEGLHRLMAFLRDDQMLFLDWLESENLLPLNNGADYIAAGSVGYTEDLPAPDFSGRVRTIDRWGGFESQESVSISPAQYAEFVFPYLEPLMARFGKIYYGCCEPVNAVWDCLQTVPNLARLSISPWADEARMGKICRERGIVYSRKPDPNLISHARFDADALKKHFLKTAEAARGCRLEIIQRDVYVTANQPERFITWVEKAREACREAWSAT